MAIEGPGVPPPRTLREVLEIPNPNVKRFGRRTFVTRAAKAAAALGVVAAGGALGAKLLDRDNAVESVDPNVFYPDMKKGVLTPSNTNVKAPEEFLNLVAQLTQEDGQLRFVPSSGVDLTYRHKEGNFGIKYTEWDGMPPGTVISSPYNGSLRIGLIKGVDLTGRRVQSEKFDHLVLDLMVDPEYKAHETWEGNPVLKVMLPINTQTSIPLDQFHLVGTGGTQISDNPIRIVAGQPLFTIGDELLHFSNGEDGDSRQFITYGTAIPLENNKAVLPVGVSQS